MSEPVIRPATLDDIPAIREIGELAWTPVFEEMRRRLGQELFDLTRPRGVKAKPDQLEEFVRCYLAWTIVTEVDGLVAGFATWHPCRDAPGLAELSNNAVHPDFQGRGIARRQYLFLFEEMRQQGCRYVRVTTGLDDAHAPARKAYEAVGFDRELPVVTYYREL